MTMKNVKAQSAKALANVSLKLGKVSVDSAEDVITVEIGKGRHCDCEKGLASFDGASSIGMVTGDCIVIRQAKVKTRILKLNHLSFVEVLRRKMRDS